MPNARPTVRLMGRPLAALSVAGFLLVAAHLLPAGAQDRAGPAAVVGGRPISRAEVADFLYERRRETWRETLDDLVDDRIAATEGARLGLRVPPALLDRAVEVEAQARATQVKETYGEGADLATLVRDAYDLDLPAWKARVLRPRLAAQLLLQRVVRLDARIRLLVEARVLVSDDPTRAAEARGKLAAGADFGLLALKESKDPTAKAGGLLPPIARGDLVFPGVEAALFSAPAGALVGPLEVVVEGQRQWHVYKIVRRHEPWLPERGPSDPGPPDPRASLSRLEADLAARPPERAELLAWRRRVRREQGVRYFAPDGSPAGPR